MGLDFRCDAIRVFATVSVSLMLLASVFQVGRAIDLIVSDRAANTLGKSVREEAIPRLQIHVLVFPLNGSVPLDVFFIVVTTDGLPPYVVRWDFGDGSSTSVLLGNHTYAKAGLFLLRVDVSHSQSDTQNYSTTIRASPPPLHARATVTPTAGLAPLSIQVSAQVVGGTRPYRYLWLFGDGANSTLAQTTHTYVRPGFYDVQLNATDSAGAVAAANQVTVTVSAGPATSGELPFGLLITVLTVGLLAVVAVTVVARNLARQRRPR